jgi:hypothetical protein
MQACRAVASQADNRIAWPASDTAPAYGAGLLRAAATVIMINNRSPARFWRETGIA